MINNRLNREAKKDNHSVTFTFIQQLQTKVSHTQRINLYVTVEIILHKAEICKGEGSVYKERSTSPRYHELDTDTAAVICVNNKQEQKNAHLIII